MSAPAASDNKRKQPDELESEAKRARLVADQAANEAERLEAELAEIKRKAAEIKAPVELFPGDCFTAESQVLQVNCWANPVVDANWVQSEFTVDTSDSIWYWGKLKHEPRNIRPDAPDDADSDPLYLIESDVGSDGWGSIRIFRNVAVTGSDPQPIKVKQKRCMW